MAPLYTPPAYCQSDCAPKAPAIAVFDPRLAPVPARDGMPFPLPSRTQLSRIVVENLRRLLYPTHNPACTGAADRGANKREERDYAWAM